MMMMMMITTMGEQRGQCGYYLTKVEGYYCHADYNEDERQ